MRRGKRGKCSGRRRDGTGHGREEDQAGPGAERGRPGVRGRRGRLRAGPGPQGGGEAAEGDARRRPEAREAHVRRGHRRLRSSRQVGAGGGVIGGKGGRMVMGGLGVGSGIDPAEWGVVYFVLVARWSGVLLLPPRRGRGVLVGRACYVAVQAVDLALHPATCGRASFASGDDGTAVICEVSFVVGLGLQSIKREGVAQL